MFALSAPRPSLLRVLALALLIGFSAAACTEKSPPTAVDDAVSLTHSVTFSEASDSELVVSGDLQKVFLTFSGDEGLNQEAWELLERRFGAVRFHTRAGFVWLPYRAQAQILNLSERLSGIEEVARVAYSETSDDPSGVKHVVALGSDEALNQEAWEELERRFGAVRVDRPAGFLWLPVNAQAELLEIAEELPGLTEVAPVIYSEASQEPVQFLVTLSDDDGLRDEALEGLGEHVQMTASEIELLAVELPNRAALPALLRATDRIEGAKDVGHLVYSNDPASEDGLEFFVALGSDEELNEEAREILKDRFGAIKFQTPVGSVWLPINAQAWLLDLADNLPGIEGVAHVVSSEG